MENSDRSIYWYSSIRVVQVLLARTPGKAGKLAKYCLELHCDNRDFISQQRYVVFLTLNATVAQLVEHMTEDHGVTGSMPVGGTKKIRGVMK